MGKETVDEHWDDESQERWAHHLDSLKRPTVRRNVLSCSPDSSAMLDPPGREWESRHLSERVDTPDRDAFAETMMWCADLESARRDLAHPTSARLVGITEPDWPDCLVRWWGCCPPDDPAESSKKD